MQLGKNEQHQKSLSLLQLFSYKTYQDYLGESLLWLQFSCSYETSQQGRVTSAEPGSNH